MTGATARRLSSPTPSGSCLIDARVALRASSPRTSKREDSEPPPLLASAARARR